MSVLDENVRRRKIFKMEYEEGLELTGSFIAQGESEWELFLASNFLVKFWCPNGPDRSLVNWTDKRKWWQLGDVSF